MAGAFFIQKTRFMNIVREILQEIAGTANRGLVPSGVAMQSRYRIERDALIALQICAESLLTNIFEMAYTPSEKISDV